MTMHRSRHPAADQCPIRDVLDRLGDRWTALILNELREETLRFSELRRRIDDISQRMLAQTLRRLEQDGLVSRTVYASVPPRVDYRLTELGRSLLGPLDEMVRWAEKHHDDVRAARRRYTAPSANLPK